ncbi:hypothetical protein EV360DRAFT_66937 [Lentinula raphanica]|nr:hypothetical protein EV360DRAFT_66937 [Lentinula raphanica]
MTTIHSPAPVSRRTIRFAPLPDPRRSVLVTDDGTELPLLSPPLLEGPNFDLLASKLELPSTSASDLASIPAALSLSALSSPAQTPLQTPQSWNVSLPDVVSSPTASPAPSPSTYEKTLSSESEGSNSSNTSSSSSPPTSEISSSASSMYSLTPTQSIDKYSASTGSSTPTQPVRKSTSLRSKLSSKYNLSTDQILTLGTINLFRRGSKGKDRDDSDTDSISSAQGWGTALSRWTSSGSGGFGRDGVGVPMHRTQSTQSYKGENVRNAKRSSSPASIRARNKPRSSSASSRLNPAHENGMLSTLHTGQSKKGTRMLNGRVYGAKRGSVSGSQANPFANAKDDPDPEFVEWGYGGMGSVKNVQDGVGGTVWGRVLSNGTSVMDSGCPEKQANTGRTLQNGGARDDEDDGSGMGWVRKRREQRAKEAAEKAEKERQEREAQEKAKANETNDSDTSDSRSFASTTTTGTAGTATSTLTTGNTKNVPAPLPLPDGGEPDVLSTDGVASPLGSSTPTFGSTMITPTPSTVGTPKPRAIEGVLSSPSSPERNVVSPVLRAASMSRQSSNAPTISNLGGSKDEQQHVLTAVNVPAPPPMSKHHSSHHSRGKSLQDAIPKIESIQGKAEPTADENKDLPVSESTVGEKAAEDQAADIQRSVEEPETNRSLKSRHSSVSSTSSSASSASSQSESESDSESEKNANDSDEEEEDEDEDESEEEKDRKTSLGAGVEKISRHK